MPGQAGGIAADRGTLRQLCSGLSPLADRCSAGPGYRRACRLRPAGGAVYLFSAPRPSALLEVFCATAGYRSSSPMRRGLHPSVLGRPRSEGIRRLSLLLREIVSTIVLAVVIGAIYFGVKNDRYGIQNRLGALFFITLNQMFSGVSAIELFIVERKLFMHEYISGYYRISTYFIAKLISDVLPMRSIPGIIFTCITYFMIGFQPTLGAFFIMMLTLVLTSLSATATALAIASGQGNATVSTVFANICFVLMTIFSGLLVNLTTTLPWLTWLKYFSIHRYGVTALQVNEFVGLDFCGNITERALKTCSRNSPFMMCSGEDYLKSQGIDTTRWGLWNNHIALACMTVIFLVIAYLKLCHMKKLS